MNGNESTPMPTQLKQHHNIAAFASKDSTRPILNGVFIDGEHKRAVATDGRILASIPCPTESEQQAIIPTRALESALAGSKKAYLGAALLNDTITKPTPNGSTVSTFDPIDGRYPNWKHVVPDFKDDRTLISIDAKYLKMLADYAIKHASKAPDTSGKSAAWVTLGIKDSHSPLTASVALGTQAENDGDDAQFVIMSGSIVK